MVFVFHQQLSGGSPIFWSQSHRRNEFVSHRIRLAAPALSAEEASRAGLTRVDKSYCGIYASAKQDRCGNPRKIIEHLESGVDHFVVAKYGSQMDFHVGLV